MNFLTQIFGGAGAAVIGADINQITDYATIAYAIIAGELLVILLLLAAILLWGIAVVK
jgi:hypothetical protein